MGAMTDDMKRLRGEVEALRVARGALMQDLALGTTRRRDAVSMMQAGFRKTHGEMARNAKAERRAFSKTHGEMARNAKAERRAFITGQKRAVAHLREEFANDLAGAARAWLGARA